MIFFRDNIAYLFGHDSNSNIVTSPVFACRSVIKQLKYKIEIRGR